MHREYDLFRRVGEKSGQWLYSIIGLPEACDRLAKEAAQSLESEVYVEHVRSNTIVARMNIPAQDLHKSIFFVGFGEPASANVSASLTGMGYTVTVHRNNATAKLVLELPQSYKYFVLGNGPDEPRDDICRFIKRRFPGASVLALNMRHESLAGADLNLPAISIPGRWVAALQGHSSAGSPLLAGSGKRTRRA